MFRIKVIGKFYTDKPYSSQTITCGDCLFLLDPTCTEYDWVVVYDEIPKANIGTIRNQREKLHCPQEQTILVTSEPPSIKIYPRTYTHQFGYVITTQLPCYLPHPNHIQGQGSLMWMADYPIEEVFSMREYPKSKQLSTVCSSKQQTHTLHRQRYILTKYISQHIPQMDWFGWGVQQLDKKYKALSSYRYHLAVENYIENHHWSDKISDPLLGLCLTFYAGDPKLGNILPEKSFIPIPLHDPEKALLIIQEAISNNEYEKRLPDILQARRLIVEKYNFFRQVETVILHHQARGKMYIPSNGGCLQGRHRLRHNPLNAISAAFDNLRGKWILHNH